MTIGIGFGLFFLGIPVFFIFKVLGKSQTIQNIMGMYLWQITFDICSPFLEMPRNVFLTCCFSDAFTIFIQRLTLVVPEEKED